MTTSFTFRHPPKCRCLDESNRPCRHRANRGGLYCSKHQSCQMSPLSAAEPPFNPDRYNSDPMVQETHNCWSYSMDVLDPDQLTQCANKPTTCQLRYHQPGGTKGLSKLLGEAKGRSCATVERLMRADVPEIQPTTFGARCPADTSKIALVVHPGEDYHFYREDPDGFWSHKDGANKVKRYDAEGKPIVNPQTAARDYRPRGSFLNYKDFCGFYCVPRRKTIRLARGGGSRRRNQKSRRRR